jgi:hypothetical protein
MNIDARQFNCVNTVVFSCLVGCFIHVVLGYFPTYTHPYLCSCFVNNVCN